MGQHNTLSTRWRTTEQNVIDTRNEHSNTLIEQQGNIHIQQQAIKDIKTDLATEILDSEQESTRTIIIDEQHPLLDTEHDLTQIILNFQQLLKKERKHNVNDSLTQQ